MGKLTAATDLGKQISDDILGRIIGPAERRRGANGGPTINPLETIDLPAGSDPRYKGAAPDRSGGAYPRYSPARGAPARMQRLLAAADDPAHPIHSMFDGYIERGRNLDGSDWYNTEELRDWFTGTLGQERGDAEWREFMELIGTTSTGSKVPQNMRNASFYRALQGEDRLAVAQGVKDGQGTPRAVAERMGVAPANLTGTYGYGHKMQRNHATNVINHANGEWAREVPEHLTGADRTAWLQANPKTKGFGNDLLGSTENIAADMHFLRMLAMSDGSPDFLHKAASLSAENIDTLRGVYPMIDQFTTTRLVDGKPVSEVKLANMVKAGHITDTSAFSNMPTAWHNSPEKNEYEAFEQLAQRVSSRYGMTPAQFQANLWMGAGDMTGLADESQGTFMDLFRRAVDKRAAERGLSREQMARDFLINRAPLAVTPLAGAGGVGLLGAASGGDPELEGYLREIGARQ